MRFENDGMVLWYGTPDAPAPLGTVSAAAGGHQAIVDLTVAVQPASASNSVIVHFRVNEGPLQTVPGAFSQHNVVQKAQYFVATFPTLQLTDKVDYVAICQCPGRQVPDKEQAAKLVSSFAIVPAASPSKPRPASADNGSEVAPSAVEESRPASLSDDVPAQICLVAAVSTPQLPEPPASAPTAEASIEESPGDPVADPVASAAARVDRAEPFPAIQPSVGVESTQMPNPAPSLRPATKAPQSLIFSPTAVAQIEPAAAQSSSGSGSSRTSRLESPIPGPPKETPPDPVPDARKLVTSTARASSTGAEEEALSTLRHTEAASGPVDKPAATMSPEAGGPVGGEQPSPRAKVGKTVAPDTTQSVPILPSVPQSNQPQPRPPLKFLWESFPPTRVDGLEDSASTLQISLAPAEGVKVSASVSAFFVDVVYSRAIGGEVSTGLADLPNTVQETVRATLDGNLCGKFALTSVASSAMGIEFCFLGANSSVRLRKTVAPESGGSFSTAITTGTPLSVELSAEEVAAIVAPDLHPVPSTPLIDRRAHFVPVGDQRVPFADSTLQIAPVRVANGGWKKQGLDQLFHSDLAISTAVQWNGGLWAGSAAVPWSTSHLAIDGQFRFRFPKDSGDAWIWWLSGPLAAIGIVLDDLSTARVTSLGVPLPPFSGAAPAGNGLARVPSNVTEAELVANPQIYTEDPGEFCAPFKNPERVLGERSFFVVLRAEQPVISAEASVRKDPLPTLIFNPPTKIFNPPAVGYDPSDATFNPSVAAYSRSATSYSAPATSQWPPGAAASFARSAVQTTGMAPEIMVDPIPGTVIDDEGVATFVRQAIPYSYLDALNRSDRGRTELDAAHPIQWESDVSRYQATTVARGHILELRMRWRSNGYSLGTVAKTLTLAPRQTKRIQKIDWQSYTRARRQETTQLSDQVSDTVTRDRDYQDAVQANLSEWAQGESHSTMWAAAGGFGLALSGFVVGGGGGKSHADSSSSQEGGRQTTASEEQRLRDSIRRYGDSLRKLDSMVVNEVTEEETVTGTTEVIRNANYGHSLTVIYYQILRHLKIETGVAGVRECLFVPFAITPFTVPRAYRWREFIQKALRDPQYAGAIKFLKDVWTNFASSDVPPGRRSEQPVRYIFGSLFIKLAVERPRDKEDGSFDAATWAVVRPFLGSPALSIFSRLKALEEAQRDAVFQQQHAGAIAARWVETLLIDVGGPPLKANFTLATRYQFNGVARVDFSIAGPAGVTREALASIRISAGSNLPPGSVANLQSLTFTYQTDHFQRAVGASQGAEHLVEVESGMAQGGASIGTIPDLWERRDVRAEMSYAVQGLIEHLNEHVEYYTNNILWNLDRNKLWMLIDGFYVPGTNNVSIASVVERDPIAIIGNSIVFRVSAGSFLGIGDITTPAQLFNHYVALDAPSEPMLVSLPTDGLYAQTIMDECPALEEHFGNTDWVLNDPDPALGEIAPELLASRRAEPQGTQPTQLPQTIINLQNAPEAPAPSGLAGALSAVTTPNAFRDMAGLAGTQANAATAFQTAANLATNFGNQAAALKLAEIAKDAHAAQTADQKIATVQRAADKNLVTGGEAQRHTSQILESLHAPSTPTRPHQDPTISQAIFAAAGKPGSTIQASTPEGQVSVSLASLTSATPAGGAAAAAPAAAAAVPSLPSRVDGIDIYDGNNMPSPNKLEELGISFVLHKSSDGAGHLDTQYQTRRDTVRANGIIYGSFHFFRFWTAATLDDSVTAQVTQAVGVVQRVLPGELGPSLDFEEKSWNDPDLGHANAVNPWTPKQWVDAIQKYSDGVEVALGRTPIIYTSWQVWHEAVEENNHAPNPSTDSAFEFDPDTSFLRNYPLWVKFYYDPPATRYADRLTRLPDEMRHLPTPWLDWAIWQYSDAKPTELADLEAQTDMDVSRGTLYRLRGMADLDHTAPHTAGNLTFIAYAQPDGRVHLLTNLGFWIDWDLFNEFTPQPALAAGDPAAAIVGNEQVILYRDRNGHIQALSRTLSSQGGGWTPPTDLTNETGALPAADDPFLTVIQDQLHAVYWATNDHQVHLSRTDKWHAEDLTDRAAGAPSASGSGAAYAHENSLHVVSRGDMHGHLFDLTDIGGPPKDLTASARATAGPVPAATYRPSVYASASGAPRIVFRALRGDIWQIERDTLNATNLSTTAGHAPPAVGRPSAIVSDTTHIFYRAFDPLGEDTIVEMFDDAGTWRRRSIRCDAVLAADPTGFVDANGQTAVSFRTTDGAIHVATLSRGAWVCEETAPPQLNRVANTSVPMTMV
jgi:GH25 family lysozyme M1 (1,4-beta-N-acetylmuramidase)